MASGPRAPGMPIRLTCWRRELPSCQQPQFERRRQRPAGARLVRSCPGPETSTLYWHNSHVSDASTQKCTCRWVTAPKHISARCGATITLKIVATRILGSFAGCTAWFRCWWQFRCFRATTGEHMSARRRATVTTHMVAASILGCFAGCTGDWCGW